jgi:RHS repeat-associated protein
MNTDHLGNVLTTISDRKKRLAGTTPAFEAVIETAQDYYPFGSLMPGRKYNAGEYRFGFNGQEKDDEIAGVTGSHLDFGARIYDSRIGRWLAVDPLSKKYPWMSPFNFAANNPILFVDTDGREVRVAGDVKKAEADMKSVLPQEYQSKLKVVDDKLVFDITHEELLAASDPLVLIVYDLIQSEKVYEWNVSDKVEVIDYHGDKKVRVVSEIWATSQSGDRFRRLPENYLKKIRNSGKQVYGVRRSQTRTSTQDRPTDPTIDYQRTINPEYSHSEDDPRKTSVTHEILEMYFEGEKGLPYSTNEEMYDGPEKVGAHNSAINVQSTLTDDRKGKNNGSTPVRDKDN